MKVFVLDKKRCLEHSFDGGVDDCSTVEIVANEKMLADNISTIHSQFRDTVVTA